MQEMWQTLREFLNDSMIWTSLLLMGAIKPVKPQKRLTIVTAYESQRIRFAEDRIMARENKAKMLKLEKRINKLNETQKINLDELHPDDYTI